MKKQFTILLLFITVIARAQNKPNVLFIAIDDLNDFVNCMVGTISKL